MSPTKTYVRSNLLRGIALVVLALLVACGQATPVPTATPPLPTTAVPSPTSRPTATPTPMPEMPEGPFTWSGETRPLLMAHYMPWYQTSAVSGSWGWHWTMNHFTPSKIDENGRAEIASHFYPLTGPYDSSDEAVLEYQVLLMKLSGIDGVIVDWYGNESFWDYGLLNASTNKLFEVIKKAGLKFVICYEDQTIKHMVDNKHIAQEDGLKYGQDAMRYLRETWAGDEAYLKVSGRPLLFTFGPQYFKAPADWESLFADFDPKPLFITLENKVVPAASAGYPWPPMWASKGGILSHDILLGYLDSFYDTAEDWEYVVGGAFPGFYDIYKEAGVGSSYGYLDALDGKTFRFTLQKALDHNPDMIQLITWNDYGEGTIIEPTIEFEYRYLEMVQEARQVTSAGNFTYTAEDLRFPLKLYNLRAKYATDEAATAQLKQAFSAALNGDLEAAAKIIASFQE